MNEPQGPEPSGWELMRAINGIRDDFRDIKSGFVSTEAFNSLKADVEEMKANSKFKVTSWLSVLGTVLAAGTAIWAILKG